MSVWRVSGVNLIIYLEGRKANKSLEPIGGKGRPASRDIGVSTIDNNGEL
jgi:hypothetical protein